MAASDTVLRPYEGMNTVFATRNVENSATHLKAYLKQDSKILDVGCGPGSITIDLARLCPNGNVVGVDMNKEALALAQDTATQSGASNVNFQLEDASAEPFLSSFPSNTFDIVHAHQVLLHLREPVRALREMRRVVKPGGIVSSRDKTIFYFDPPTENMEAMRNDIDTKLIPHSDGGRWNHLWAHEAGFGWDKITTGSCGWEWSGEEMRKIAAPGMAGAMREVSISKGLHDQAFFDDLAKDWDEWAKNPAARVQGLDGWFVAVK